MVSTLPPPYRLLDLKTRAELDTWRDRFAEVYVAIFSGPPYHEQFTVEEARRVWDRLTRIPGHITLVIATEADQLAAFGVAIPLSGRPDVARELTGLVPMRHTWYLAEMGVSNDHRGHDLGRVLIRERIQRMDREQVSHVVMRVSESNSRSKALYLSLGFEDMGVYMEVPGLRTDGSVRADRRLFLSRVLSQVAIE